MGLIGLARLPRTDHDGNCAMVKTFLIQIIFIAVVLCLAGEGRKCGLPDARK
jgi:hypothetical protein